MKNSKINCQICTIDISIYGKKQKYCLNCCKHKTCKINIDYNNIFQLICNDCKYSLDLIEIISDNQSYGLINYLWNRFKNKEKKVCNLCNSYKFYDENEWRKHNLLHIKNDKNV